MLIFLRSLSYENSDITGHLLTDFSSEEYRRKYRSLDMKVRERFDFDFLKNLNIRYLIPDVSNIFYRMIYYLLNLTNQKC